MMKDAGLWHWLKKPSEGHAFAEALRRLHAKHPSMKGPTHEMIDEAGRMGPKILKEMLAKWKKSASETALERLVEILEKHGADPSGHIGPLEPESLHRGPALRPRSPLDPPSKEEVLATLSKKYQAAKPARPSPDIAKTREALRAHFVGLQAIKRVASGGRG